MPEVRPCFLVEADYVEGAAEKREPFREAHLDRVEKLQGEGALLLAGAFEDLRGSLLVFDVGSEEAVAAIIESDVYWRNGIWTDYRIRRMNRVVVENGQ